MWCDSVAHLRSISMVTNEELFRPMCTIRPLNSFHLWQLLETDTTYRIAFRFELYIFTPTFPIFKINQDSVSRSHSCLVSCNHSQNIAPSALVSVQTPCGAGADAGVRGAH